MEFLDAENVSVGCIFSAFWGCCDTCEAPTVAAMLQPLHFFIRAAAAAKVINFN